MSISQQIKQAIRACDVSPYRVAVSAGVSDSVLSRFLSDDATTHRDILIERTADALATFLRLVPSRGGKAESVTISAWLREAVRSSGRTVTDIAADAGIAQPVLQRFMAGKDLYLERTADKLAEHMGMKLGELPAGVEKVGRKRAVSK